MKKQRQREHLKSGQTGDILIESRHKRITGLTASAAPFYAGPVNRTYTVILEQEATGGYHAFCPALKGCHSEGETEAEALQNIREAIELYLESLVAHQEPIPEERLQVTSVPVVV